MNETAVLFSGGHLCCVRQCGSGRAARVPSMYGNRGTGISLPIELSGDPCAEYLAAYHFDLSLSLFGMRPKLGRIPFIWRNRAVLRQR